MRPGAAQDTLDVSADRFHLWWRQGSKSRAQTLAAEPTSQYDWPVSEFTPLCLRLFPFEWRDFSPLEGPVQLQSLHFSPLIPGNLREASLPVHVVVWRAHNCSPMPVEAALMLTWACGWPDMVQAAEFDMQHDNLCITGSLGDPASAVRQGIAVPDLHSHGIYLQGMEPWDPTGNGGELWSDFAEDGELDSAVVGKPPHAAAAWVKFDLDPGEVKEIPFVIVWHFPTYEAGPMAGKHRYYTQFLGKYRPDNAIVWLAEEAVQNYGTEAANYKHWISQISDWHEAVLSNPAYTGPEHCEQINGLGALVECSLSLTAEGKAAAAIAMDQLKKLEIGIPLDALWPEIGAGLTRMR